MTTEMEQLAQAWDHGYDAAITAIQAMLLEASTDPGGWARGAAKIAAGGNRRTPNPYRLSG